MMRKILDKFQHNHCDNILHSPKKYIIILSIIHLICGFGLMSLKSDFSYKAWYSDKDPNVQKFNSFEKYFGNDDNLIISLKNTTGILNVRDLNQVKDLTDLLWGVEDIVRVESITNFQFMNSTADDIVISDFYDGGEINEKSIQTLTGNIKKWPFLYNFLISKDHKTFVLQSILRPALNNPPDHSKVSGAHQKILENFKKKNPQFEVHLTGPVRVVDDFKNATIDDLVFLIPFLYLIFSILLYLRFKSISSIFSVFLVVSSSSFLALGIAGFLNQNVNTLTAAAPTIIMTIAISDAIHLLSSYFYALKSGKNYFDSIKYSMNKNFYPTLLTSLTTAIGFFTFYGAKVEPISELGVMVGIGVICAWFVTYWFLCPLILLFPTKFKSLVGKSQFGVISKSNIKAITRFLNTYRRYFLISTIMSVAAGVYCFSSLEINMNPLDQFRHDHPGVQASRFMEKNMGYSSGLELLIDSGVPEGINEPSFLLKVDHLSNWILESKIAIKTNSILDIIKKLNMTFNEGQVDFYKIPNSKKTIAESIFFYSLGLPQGQDLSSKMDITQSKLRLSLTWNTLNSKDALLAFEKIKMKSKQLGLNVLVTGKTTLFHQLTPYVVTTFIKSFGMAFLLITLILMIYLKSIKLGLLALIPNIWPLLVGSIIFYLGGFTVDMGSVIIASVCLGVAVDDSIHFLFEYKKSRDQDSSIIEAVEKVYDTTFPSLFLTTIVLSIGFASFVFGSYIPNIIFGVFVAIILLLALFSDLIILPVVLMYVDKD